MNQTTQRGLELESRYENDKDCGHIVIIEVPKAEMKEASDYFSTHLYTAFEKTNFQDYMMFEFKSVRHTGLVIEVRSKELHRRKIDIIEI